MLALAVASLTLAAPSPMIDEVYVDGCAVPVVRLIWWPQHWRSASGLLPSDGSVEISSRTHKARVWAGSSL